jgi:outer membrane protein assembly factor BamB
MATGVVLLAGLLLKSIWLAVSRLRRRTRRLVLLGFVALVALTAALLRYDGVNGDLVPLFSLRWSAARTQTGAAKALDGAADFPQFLGAARDGVINGVRLAHDWKAHPPELLWRRPVGEAWSGFAIARGAAVTQEQAGPEEAIVCYDLATGAERWRRQYPARYDDPLGGIGPRATPAISGSRVFALGAKGTLHCLDLATGAVVWQRDILADAQTKAPAWGVSGSPLVDGELVVVHPGGPHGNALAAYRIANGERAWHGGDAGEAYSSPQRVTLLGEPQWLNFNAQGVAAQAIDDGHELWKHRWPSGAQRVSDPRVVAPDRVLASTGYGVGADLLRISRDSAGAWKTERLWHSRHLRSKFAPIVVRDDSVFGLDDGRLTCIDLTTGEPRWKGERYGHGQFLLVGDVLLISAENGEVVLVEASPEAEPVLGRFEALNGKTWNPPALGGAYLIVRNNHEAACFRLPIEEVR